MPKHAFRRKAEKQIEIWVSPAGGHSVSLGQKFPRVCVCVPAHNARARELFMQFWHSRRLAQKPNCE